MTSLPIISTGSIEQYISAVNKIPMLTLEREQDLAAKTAAGDLAAATELIMSHLRLVCSMAKKMEGYGIPTADLIQEGNIGLMKAVKAYDASHGIRVSSYAMHWIRAEIFEYVLRNWRLVKVATTKSHRKLFFNLRSMTDHLGSMTPAEVAEVAKLLNVSESDVIEMEKRLTNAELSIDMPDSDSDESESRWRYTLTTEVEDSPENMLAELQHKTIASRELEQALAQLSPREVDIVQSRFLCEPEDRITLSELGKKYGVTTERIRQLEAAIVKKMRQLLPNTVALRELDLV